MNLLVGRCVTTILLLFGAGLVVSVGAAAPAYAASCSGHGCDGKDPISSGCSSGAYTVLSSPIRIIPMFPGGGTVVGTLDLRYSPACGTNWIRATTTGGAIRWISLWSQRSSDGYTETESGNYSTAWTNMMYAPTVQVCGLADMWDQANTWQAESDGYVCA